MHLILLILPMLFSRPTYSQSINLDHSPSPIFSQDYGQIIVESPTAVLSPTTPEDISILLKIVSSSPLQNNVTVAARGAGHSTHGQAETEGGIVIDMTSLPTSIQVHETYVDAGGGALWVDVLNETLKYGLSPISWTDYLYLTVGGTLSNAGISGQAFKHGPEIVNVIELDVVTGKGEHITCSEHVNSDLFYGVLGGLGQFGIITRARIVIERAPKMVKRVNLQYSDFDQFTEDEEFLIKMGDVDYLEGFVNLPAVSISNNVSSHSSRDDPVEPTYSIELAIYYDDKDVVDKVLIHVLTQLRDMRSNMSESDVPYFDFLNRVKVDEDELRKKGLWEVPHPWLVLLVPKAQIGRFKDLLIQTLSSSFSGGLIIMYPTLRDKWNLNMSAVLPQVNIKEDVIYAVSILQSASPSCVRGSECLNFLLSQNQKIIDIATSMPTEHESSKRNTTSVAATGLPGAAYNWSNDQGGMGAKQYLSYWKSEDEWRVHFGGKWDRFRDLKSRFDPLNILAPGQRIFKRKPILV